MMVDSDCNDNGWWWLWYW